MLTASDATQYAFEGDDVRGSGTSSVFTHHLVEAIRSGEADLDQDGDIALDELYSYVRDLVIGEMPQQRPKKQEDVDGRILIARNVHWTLPAHLWHALESPITMQRLTAVQELERLHRLGNDIVRAAVAERLTALANDDSRAVSAAASALLQQIQGAAPARDVTAPNPSPTAPEHEATRVAEQQATREAEQRARIQALEQVAREGEDPAAREAEQRVARNGEKRAKREPVRTLTGHTSGVGAVAVTPDGRQIVSGAEDKTVRGVEHAHPPRLTEPNSGLATLT